MGTNYDSVTSGSEGHCIWIRKYSPWNSMETGDSRCEKAEKGKAW